MIAPLKGVLNRDMMGCFRVFPLTIKICLMYLSFVPHNDRLRRLRLSTMKIKDKEKCLFTHKGQTCQTKEKEDVFLFTWKIVVTGFLHRDH